MIHAYAAHEPGGKLVPFEYDPGPLGAGEVEIDVMYCGICHSDLSMLDNEWGLSEFPLVLGHEVVGSIAQVGADVTSLQSGQIVGLGWNLYLNTLKPKGRLHFVGATLDPLNLEVFDLIMAQRSVSGSPVGSPGTIARMLEFANRHQIRPVIETFPMEQVNEALARLRSGEARYRIVLER